MAFPTCPQCGSDIPVGTETCPTCGRALTARTTGTRAPRVTRTEAAGVALALAGLVVGGIVLFVVGRFHGRTAT